MKKILFILSASLVLCFSCNHRPGSSGHPTMAEVEPDSTLRLNCKIEVEPNNREMVLNLAKELVDSSRQDEGKYDYALYESQTSPYIMLILETWQDQAALNVHSATSHFQRLVPEIQKNSKMSIETFQAESTDVDSIVRVNCFLETSIEDRDTVIALCKRLVAASVKDEGNIDYDIFAHSSNPNLLLFVETWKNQAFLDSHSEAPHFKKLVPLIQQFATMRTETFRKPKANKEEETPTPVVESEKKP